MKILKIFLLSFLIFNFNKVDASDNIYEIDTSYYNSWYEVFFEAYPQWQDYNFVNNICNDLIETFSTDKEYFMCSFNIIKGTSRYGVLINGVKYLPIMNVFKFSSNVSDFAPFTYDFLPSDGSDGSGYIVINSDSFNNYSYSRKTFYLDAVNGSTINITKSYSGSTFRQNNFFTYDESSGLYHSNLNQDYFSTIINHNIGLYATYSNYRDTTIKVRDELFGYDNPQVLPYVKLWPDTFIKYYSAPIQPTYEYTSTLLDNGNVKLVFTFNDYNDSNIYGFTITNEVSGEEYGIENPFSSIFPNIIPFGSSYSIEVPYDTYIYITLAKYEKYEDSELYYRTEIYTDTIDINNVVFSNPQDTYFQLLYSSQKNLTGIFKNVSKDSTCYFVRSNNLDVESEVSCSEQVSVDVNFNGYVKFYVKQKDNIIYSRNINVLGNPNSFLPYIIYSVDKQDFYSVINWSVSNQNFDSNMNFRYSLDNGNTFTPWTLIDNSTNFNINVFENSYVIIEISNSDNSTIYDSKSISVVVDISTIKDFNNTTNNFINKFISIFSVNPDILKNVNIFWNTIKTSKLFLVIFIPFLGALICGIIYLIRRD